MIRWYLHYGTPSFIVLMSVMLQHNAMTKQRINSDYWFHELWCSYNAWALSKVTFLYCIYGSALSREFQFNALGRISNRRRLLSLMKTGWSKHCTCIFGAVISVYGHFDGFVWIHLPCIPKNYGKLIDGCIKTNKWREIDSFPVCGKILILKFIK